MYADEDKSEASAEPSMLRLYYDFLSQPSRALYILLKASGTDFEERAVDLLAGEHTSDEYRQQVNRFQKVPAIIDADGFRLAESIAILRYLQRRQLIASSYYEPALQARARCDEFLQWQHNGIRSSCSLYFRFTWLQTKVFGEPAAAGKVLKYRDEMESDLAWIERIWLQQTKYLSGDAHPTVADLFGACEIEQIKLCGYDVREKFPKIAAWIEAVRADFAPHFDVAHAWIYEQARQTMAAGD